MRKTSSGMTMMEMMIALIIFSAVMVGVIQSLISSTNYVDFDEARNNLNLAEMEFQKRTINDLANAAWFYRYDPIYDKLYINPVTKEHERLYPVTGKNGDTLEFIKLRTSSTVSDSPSDEHYATTNFKAKETVVGLHQFLDALPTPLMVMNPDYIQDPQWFVAAAWESNEAGLSFDDNQNPERLRHYLYAVEKDSSGTSNLVRKYLNGYVGSPPPIDKWILDDVLIQDVVDVKFELPDPLVNSSLNENQISISVLVQRTPQGSAQTGVTVKRRIQFTASMRSINQEN